MGRPVVLSNGQMFVGIDESGLVHDFYYPYVGLENLTNARSSQHKIGVWANGQFRWTDDGSWDISITMESDALVGNITAESKELQVKLQFTDFIDVEVDALIRRVEATNLSDQEQDIRLFMHQVFQISHWGRGDTAMFVPDDDYILDYKGRCCLLAAGKLRDDKDFATFDQYAVGNYGIEGKDGTFRDAEDGELSGNTVEHGGVDSVIRFQQIVQPGKALNVDYWIAAAASQTDAQVIHTKLKYYDIEDRLQTTRDHYKKWLASGKEQTSGLSEEYQIAVQKSLLIIKAHCDSRGSILASGDSSIFNFGRDYYCYCWPRDAAYALWPLIRTGHYEEAKKFFGFARDTMHPDGYLMHKYQPDRAIGSTWHPLLHNNKKELAIQEDETASVVFMMHEYFKASHDKAFVEDFYDSFIVPAARFMVGYIDDETGLPHASYDLWEQKFSTSTYSVCTVIAGLDAAAELAKVVGKAEDAIAWTRVAGGIQGNLAVLFNPAGYFNKGYLLQENGELAHDETLDISNLYGPYMYARTGDHDERIQSTAQHVEEKLLNSGPIGGVIRYPGDDYFLAKPQYGGNPWIVCSLWLAQYYLDSGKTDDAKKLIDWSLARMLPSGVLSEQFDPEDGGAIGVTPLVWSHAEVVNTLLDYQANLRGDERKLS